MSSYAAKQRNNYKAKSEQLGGQERAARDGHAESNQTRRKKRTSRQTQGFPKPVWSVQKWHTVFVYQLAKS
jgi:hypothetical protein